MKKHISKTDHPEIKEIKNICNVTPEDNSVKKINQKMDLDKKFAKPLTQSE